jgi:hypothetical protein
MGARPVVKAKHPVAEAGNGQVRTPEMSGL